MNTTTRHTTITGEAARLLAGLLDIAEEVGATVSYITVNQRPEVPGSFGLAVDDPAQREALNTRLDLRFVHAYQADGGRHESWGGTFQGCPVQTWGPVAKRFAVVDSDTGEHLTQPMTRDDAADVAALSPSRRVHVEAVA